MAFNSTLRLLERNERLEQAEASEETLHRLILVDRQNPIEHLHNEAFKKRYRFTKETVMYLMQILDLRIGRSHSVPVLFQLLVALRYYATGHFQRTDGDLLMFSQPTVCRIVKKVSNLVAEKASMFIKFPSGFRDIATLKMKFSEIAGLSGIVGAIDCSHISIVSTGTDNAEIFRNRKGFFSVNVQYVCDATMSFTNIVARWPGSVHDARIFSNSTIYHLFESGTVSGILLGDGGYPCLPYLFTPVRNPITAAERRFNAAHVKTRQVVERAFGVLKQRFRCLRIPLRTNLSTSLSIIVATACLHNIAIAQNDVILSEELDYEDSSHSTPLIIIEHDDETGQSVRRHFIQRNYC